MFHLTAIYTKLKNFPQIKAISTIVIFNNVFFFKELCGRVSKSSSVVISDNFSNGEAIQDPKTKGITRVAKFRYLVTKFIVVVTESNLNDLVSSEASVELEVLDSVVSSGVKHTDIVKKVRRMTARRMEKKVVRLHILNWNFCNVLSKFIGKNPTNHPK